MASGVPNYLTTDKVLDALDAAGLASGTRIVYTSDHGDALGMRGLWGKSRMYEETCGVPLITAGDDFPKGAVVRTPTNLGSSRSRSGRS